MLGQVTMYQSYSLIGGDGRSVVVPLLVLWSCGPVRRAANIAPPRPAWPVPAGHNQLTQGL